MLLRASSERLALEVCHAVWDHLVLTQSAELCHVYVFVIMKINIMVHTP